MSVFGIDLGNAYSTVSIARRKGIDIIINEVSKRETSTVVSFGTEQEGRMIGEKGADMKIRNWKNTVNNLKRLVGVRVDSKEWEHEKQFCLFDVVEGKDGFVNVEVGSGDRQVMRPEQVIAMMLHKLSTYADREANADAGIKTGIKLVDFVLSVPPYYSAFQRKLLTQATTVSGLNCLTLVTEGTAVALGWGIFQTDLPEKEEDGIVVQFCDCGHSSTYISTVKFWKGNMKVLSHVFDKNLGCRDFDLVLADHFRAKIQEKYKMDVYEQKKAKLRLVAGCEKIRMTMSANPVVSLNVECIMNDVDVSFQQFQRDEFDELAAGLWERMEKLVARAGEGIDPASLHSVEVVGGGAYMPKVKKILSDAYNRSVASTMNVGEAVAKGCGVLGAILSPRMKVEFQVMDALVGDIMVGYKSASANPSPVSFLPEINKQSVLYADSSPFPKVYDLTFDRKEAFELYTYYKEPSADVQDANGSLLLGHWEFVDLPVFKNLKGEEEPDKAVKVAVRFRLNSSGFVDVESASVAEEYEVKEKSTKKDEEDLMVTKKRTRTIDVTVAVKFKHGMSSGEVEELKQGEAKMQKKDQDLIETQDAKNALEGYAYDFRTKAEEGGQLQPYMSEEMCTEFKKSCDEAVDWIYGDGEDTTKEEYVKKLTALRVHGDTAMTRLRLREELPFVFSEVDARILAHMDEANRLMIVGSHIEYAKLEEIVKRGTEAREKIKAEKLAFEATPNDKDITSNPSLLTSKAIEVDAFAKPIFATPKPPPPAPEKTEEGEEKKEGDAPEEKKEEKAESPKAEHKPDTGMELD